MDLSYRNQLIGLLCKSVSWFLLHESIVKKLNEIVIFDQHVERETILKQGIFGLFPFIMPNTQRVKVNKKLDHTQ